MGYAMPLTPIAEPDLHGITHIGRAIKRHADNDCTAKKTYGPRLLHHHGRAILFRAG
jgi:hypothetical protein